MKRIFTLICLACCVLCTALAQDVDETFQFVFRFGDNDYVLPDGERVSFKFYKGDEKADVPFMVKNISGKKVAASMYETIDEMPGGTWQTCAFGNCMQLDASGYSSKSIVDADYFESIATEWIPATIPFATWEATLQIHLFNIVSETKFGTVIERAGDQLIGRGPTLTIRFECFDDSEGIRSADATPGVSVDTIHDLNGRQHKGLVKGVNIVRTSQGKTYKVIR